MNAPLWFSNLLSWSLQAAVLALAAGFLPRIFQIRQPRVLLVYWRTLLLLSLALPFVQRWHRPPSLTVLLAPDFAQAPLPPPTSVPAGHWHLPDLQMVGTLVGVMLLTGIGVRFFLLALGLLKLRHFRQASSAILPFAESANILEATRILLETPAEFRLSAEVNSPVTFGFSRPVILLPERFLSLDERFQSAIACHELLHVRRHDWAHHLSEELLRAVFWFHPAVAWLISRVRLAREQVVDSEVVQLTKARKTYLEALLAFTPTRARLAVVPAPPFLIESQLAERVSLMLKEVRMSRKKLIASCVVVACCVGLAIGLAAWAFPLQGAPLSAQSAPKSGVSGGVSGGISRGVSGSVSGGVAQGISGGVAGGINGDTRYNSQGNEPNLEISTIWTATVKRGPMVRQVRGLGKVVRASDSANLIVRIALPEAMVKEVRSNQHASVDSPKGHVAGAHVIGVNPKVTNGEVSVNLALEGAIPEEIHPDQDVDVIIDIEQLNDILFVGRPVQVAANSEAPLFKIVKDGTEAERTSVKFGRTSVNTIEVLSGLKEGDKVILSDMSEWEKFERIHLK